MLWIGRSHQPGGSGVTLDLRLDREADSLTATVALPPLPVGAWERESIRWYLEDFREFPADPAPAVAAASAALIERLGGELFTGIFDGDPAAREIWSSARADIAGLDWEIDADLAGSVPIPFEMLRDPGSGIRPALAARSFAHTVRRPDPAPVTVLSGPLRILLVVARPHADLDVPFRSIAGRLIRHAAGGGPRIDVLRPPTFAALSRRLEAAAASGQPYHLVHFDGHGLIGPTGGDPEGYAVFEQPGAPGNRRLVSGAQLGEALSTHGVEALVLNACSSGRSESSRDGTGYTSLARRCLDAGVKAVVAMRYDIYVSTATTFVTTLYDLLFQGRTLGHAASVARAGLAADEAYGEWLVPVILQAAPVAVTADDRPAPAAAAPVFVGRDDLTISIDRAFDTGNAIVLWGAAGVGKSALAEDFAEWYRSSRGVDGPLHRGSFGAEPEAGFAEPAADAPAIWIWDGLERTASWPEADRRALADRIAALAGGPVRLLLTSRDRAAWLPATVRRLQVRPLSPAESDELAGVWSPADRAFCQGHPAAIRLLTSGAAPPVADLGTGRVTADPSGAASRALAGLPAAQRSALTLLLPFRDVVSAHHLIRMHRALQLPSDLTYAEAAAILDRVADLGWFTRLDGEHYGPHPFLRHALHQLVTAGQGTPEVIEEAYCRSVALFGHGLFWAYNLGNRDTLNIIALEERNLVHAFELAFTRGRADELLGPLQALRMLYEQGHRLDAWYAMAERLQPVLLDPATLLPQPEVNFVDVSLRGVLLDYADALAARRGDPIARGGIAAARRDLIAGDLDGDDDLRQVALRSQAIQLLRDGSVDDIRRAVDLAHRISDTALEASALIDLGHAYRNDGDFDRARVCLEEALDLGPDSDTRHRARVFDGLGALMLSRFDQIVEENLDAIGEQVRRDGIEGRFTVPVTEEQAACLRSAYGYYQAALRWQGHEDRATVASLHHQLGGIAGMMALWAEADTHFRTAIAGHDEAGAVLRSAQSRGDFANHLIQRGQRYAEALLYARTAERDLLSLGDAPPALLKRARALVEELETY
ncbi:tetratricopeptide (TPR) repeat protein [Allocatelliglobosispora scoriae]|uniref:Tetratricopeptide (TPR) repeat protein n=1 Tax=Allocatelliglobosispora scoriae TaxID=643052 RepID=A0A841C360_9ACTN|nr:CHAT domain-containing protein [Allocatelliglobosispora scoriae]MBB5873573.1 tetratricopeptide (TPR) repeat protein [Allocatelliglobosispora scoriae]